MKKSIRIFQTITFLTLLLTTVFTSCRKVDDSRLENPNSDEKKIMAVDGPTRYFDESGIDGGLDDYCPQGGSNCFDPIVVSPSLITEIDEMLEFYKVGNLGEWFSNSNNSIVNGYISLDLQESLIQEESIIEKYEDSEKIVLIIKQGEDVQLALPITK